MVQEQRTIPGYGPDATWSNHRSAMPMDDDPMWEKSTLVLEKTSPRQGFGIAISGGTDNPHFKTGSTAIVVSDIVKGSPADGLLRVNDRIISVNERIVENADHASAVTALKEAGMSATIVVLRRRQMPPSPGKPSQPEIVQNQGPQGTSTPKGSMRSNERYKPPESAVNGKVEERSPDAQPDDKIRVTLEKGSKGFGFALGQLIYVSQLAPKGPALTSGQIDAGDVVLEINGNPLDKVKSLNEAIDMVRNSADKVTLLIQKKGIKPPSTPKTPKRTPKPEKPPAPSTTVETEVVEVRTQAVEQSAPMEMERSWKSPNQVQKPPERPDGPALANTTKDSWDAASPPPSKAPAPAPAEVPAQSVEVTSKWERRRMEKLKDRRLSHGHEGRYITFRKSGSLGIQVAGGNNVGIFVAAVKPDSAAALQGLKQGDLVLEANEIDFRDITREEAVLILLALGEEVTLLVEPKKESFDQIKSQLGDNFYVRANFDHFDKANANELTFRKGEIFNVRDTMYQGLIGAWQAQRVGKNGRLLDQGILPNKSRAEQLAIAQRMEERLMPKSLGGKLQRKGSVGGSLRRSKYKFTSQDKLDESSFSEISVQIPAYERVVLRIADFMRPVVILGPLADLTRLMLLDEMPDRFGTPSVTDSFYRSSTIPRRGHEQSYGDNVKLSQIRGVIAENKHCLLDITPEGIEMLMFSQLSPIVILLKSVSKSAVKEMRGSLVDELMRSPTGMININEDPLAWKQVRKIYSMSKKLEEFYPHVFTAKINSHVAGSNSLSREWYQRLKEIIFKQQSEAAWMPEEKPEETMMDEMEFRPPNYMSYVSGGESDTDGESVISEAISARRYVEDFDDSHLESPPRTPSDIPPYRARDEQVEPPVRQNYEESAPPVTRDEHVRTQITETVTMETTETVHSAPPDSRPRGEDETTSYLPGRRPEEEEDIPVLKDPRYELPSGLPQEKEEEEEKKPVNAVKVFPAGLPARDVRQSLKRTEVVKEDRVDETEVFEQELKNKGDSLRRVPADENPVMKEMDERADVKVSEVWQVETEIRGVPARPPAPRNYIVDMRRGGRNNRELVAETTYKPTPKFTEATRVTLPAPRSDRVVEERISTVRTETSVESVPNNYFDSRPPPPRDERPPSREERPPLPSYRDVPRREDRPPPPNYRDAPRSRDDYRQPPGYPEPYRGYQRDPERGYQREPEIARGYSRDPEPPRGYYDPPRTTSYQTSYRTEAREESYRDRPIDRYDEKPSRPPAPAPKSDQFDEEPKVIATARGIFDHRGGLLESTETGVSIYIPAGALPEGKKQEIYFKVCQDSKYMPPLDQEGGETLLSPLVMCGPHGLKFKKPIELRLPHKGNTADGMSFSLKSSDSPVGHPNKWKNVHLDAGRDLDSSRAYQVTDDTVSVLVDHF